MTAGALALTWAPVAAAATPPRVGSIQEAAIGSDQVVYLSGIAPGPDGNLWFADLGCFGKGRCAIGRITPKGVIRAFTRGLNPGSIPWEIAPGPDGNLWFTDEGRTPAIGRITPQGKITEFTRGLNTGSVPFEIVAGAHGDLWFTDQGSTPAIGRITPRGRITELSLGLLPGSIPVGITAGRDGEEWFTDRGCSWGGSSGGSCAIGRVGPQGRISEFTAGLRAGSNPLGIAAGPGGDVWFADSAGAIGRVTPQGRITEFSKGLYPASSPVGIAAGADGDVWFTDEGTDRPAVGRITPQGRITEYAGGLQEDSQPAFITPGPDGKEWFTDEAGVAAIGRVFTGARTGQRPSVAGRARVGARLSCRLPRWPRWAGVEPLTRLFSFDGYRWLRDGKAIGGRRGRGRAHTVLTADAGQRLACAVTATYPVPLLVTEKATSGAVTVRP